MIIYATNPDSLPRWRRLARVTRVAGTWGYWINGTRTESPAWDKGQAASAALSDLDSWAGAL